MATNNSGITPAQYAAKLAKMGAQVEPGEIMTSGTATAAWLAGAVSRGGRGYTSSARIRCGRAMIEQGFVLADEDVEVVAASIDWGVNYDKIKRAAVLIRKGAAFVATNLDPTRPTEEGLVSGHRRVDRRD